MHSPERVLEDRMEDVGEENEIAGIKAENCLCDKENMRKQREDKEENESRNRGGGEE